MATHDQADADFRARLLHQAEHAVRRLAFNHNVPTEIADEASHTLRCQFLKRFRAPADWEGVKFPQSYLNEAARNAVCRAYRRAKSRVKLRYSPELPEEAQRLFHPPDSLRERRFSYEEIMAKLAGGMKALTPTELKVMDLVRRGFTTKEIRLVLGISATDVYAHLSNARKKIRKLWRDSA